MTEAGKTTERLVEREADIALQTAKEHRLATIRHIKEGLRKVPLAYRPISSAPDKIKDGSKILIHCYWEPLTVVGKYKDGEWVVAWDEQPLSWGYEATHWAYLPGDPRDA
nr:hypothetical protein [uncultured Lichenicoccus sp.]